MIELSDIPFSLDTESLMRQLRIQSETATAEAFAGLLARVTEVGRPKALYDVAYIEDRTEDSLVLNGVKLTSRALGRNLAPVERVFPYVVTCGTEADSVAVPEKDLVQGLWLWTIKEALLGQAADYLHDHVSTRYRLTRWATMHPGSGDAHLWPIEQQKELFAVLGDVEAAIGVKLTDSMLMIPAMSVSGILYASETDFASCQVCHREGCPRRTAPFDEAVWRAVCED